jgi:hypothetical protein
VPSCAAPDHRGTVTDRPGCGCFQVTGPMRHDSHGGSRPAAAAATLFQRKWPVTAVSFTVTAGPVTPSRTTESAFGLAGRLTTGPALPLARPVTPAARGTKLDLTRKPRPARGDLRLLSCRQPGRPGLGLERQQPVRLTWSGRARCQ